MGRVPAHISTAGRPDSTKSSGQRSAARTRSSSQTYTGRGRIQSPASPVPSSSMRRVVTGPLLITSPIVAISPTSWQRAAEGDLVLTMGAGDITLVPTELAMRLAERS